MKYVLVRAHRKTIWPIFRNPGRLCDQYCDQCMPIVCKRKNCEVCHTQSKYAAHPIQGTKFVLEPFNNIEPIKLSEIPLFCQKCYDPLFTCDFHRSMELSGDICHICYSKSKKTAVLASFDDAIWTDIAKASTERIDYL